MSNSITFVFTDVIWIAKIKQCKLLFENKGIKGGAILLIPVNKKRVKFENRDLWKIWKSISHKKNFFFLFYSFVIVCFLNYYDVKYLYMLSTMQQIQYGFFFFFSKSHLTYKNV